MATLLDYVRDYAISSGLPVRKPRNAGASTVYPWFNEPRNGAVAPRNPEVEAATTETNDDLVISAFRSSGVPVERHRGSWEKIEMVEIWFRGRTWPIVSDFWTLFRPKYEDRRGWSMAGLYVMESLTFRELQRLGSDESGWTYNCELSFEIFQT